MSSPPEPPNKADLRRELRARRKLVGGPARRAAGQALIRLALRYRLLTKGRRIGLYIPNQSEIDVLPLLELAREMGVACHLPIVPRLGHKRMWFSELGEHSACVNNRYGIPEYLHPLARRVRTQQLDLLLIPLLGFDARGFRLGMGGGYYDASLSHLRSRRHWRRPRVVGVAYAVQEVARLPNDAWDIPLDAILTEREFRKFHTDRSLELGNGQ